MIDPIQNQPRPEYVPKKAVKASQAGSGGETFSLNYSEEGVLYEPSAKEETEKETAAKKEHTDSFRRSAALELSESENKTAAASDAQRPSFTETLRNFFARAAAALKKAWSFIWENKPAETTDGEQPETDEILTPEALEAETALIESGTTENPAEANINMGTALLTPTDTASKTNTDALSDDAVLHAVNDPAILNALKSGNSAKFQSLLTEDGRRIFAKNSSLLTYYDSKGNLISPDASTQQRILHGDRGSVKR